MNINDLKEKTWEEFSDTGLMWKINQMLLPLGWAIVTDVDNDVFNVYPAKLEEQNEIHK